MKLLILGVIAFVVALAGGAGLGIATAPKPKPKPATAVVAPGARSDSAAHAAPPAAPPAPTAVAAAATPQAPQVTPVDDSTRVAAAIHQASEVAAALHGPAKPSLPEDYSPIAKILTDMKPKQANEIVSHLSDDEVEGILRTVQPRSAAVLMAQMPATRAAEMSRRLMQAKETK